MTGRRLVALSLGALALTALAGLWSPVGAVIDPLLVVAVLAALPGRQATALGAGLLTGALEDGWRSLWFGLNAFTHMVVAFGMSVLAGRIDLTQTMPTALALAAATALDWALQLGISAMFDRPIGEPPAPAIWLVAMAANTLLGLFARGLMLRRESRRWVR
ncbi:MAG: hypothetical protein JSV80_01560 [Acidobacteriota bacterium]|nr:MAG: hypothetical protein JSV80_01560 [Acidobacteriota bacterium]